MSELTERVRATKREHPDWTYRQIAAAAGCSASTVCRCLNSRHAEKNRQASLRWKAEHREHVRAYDADYNATHRPPCPECGQPRWRESSGPCVTCISLRATARSERIADLYEAGVSMKDIAADLGTTVASLCKDIDRLRKTGRIGYRYTVRDGKRVAA